MRKLFLFLTVIMMVSLQTYAQKVASTPGWFKADLPVVYLPDNVSVHFISPEPIRYVDISSKNIIGDLPVRNILRIKHRPDSLKIMGVAVTDAVVTIVGEKYIAQYRVVLDSEQPANMIQTNIEIIPAHIRSLDYPGTELSEPELKNYALRLISKKRDKHLEHSKAYGIKSRLNHVYTLGGYIFIDLGFENETNLKYDIDELRFKIGDKKVTKATNVQTLEIKPDFILFDTPFFKKRYRNIFVFRKFTFPGNKLLSIELSEKQLSGRIAELKIPYKDILEADIIPVP
jgi:conjugative transposon TraN protein